MNDCHYLLFKAQNSPQKKILIKQKFVPFNPNSPIYPNYLSFCIKNTYLNNKFEFPKLCIIHLQLSKFKKNKELTNY